MPFIKLAQLRLLVLAALSLAHLCAADNDGNGDDRPAPVTTAPIFLPHYNEQSWSLVRGSIIASNATAKETAYTIFCPAQTPRACALSLEFPFVIVEGPNTVRFHGTHTSTYIANMECDLNGTVAATCSGYSSFADGFTYGLYEGPTEVSWTKTLTGTDVEWGVLTMAEVPEPTDGSINTVTGAPALTGITELVSLPTGRDSAGFSLRCDKLLAASVLAGTLVAALL
ncbi:hypothetical protein B0I35DRAFT_506636 [Stachybotrys elegans]|uniref:Uncharacterized protein n=1 Tax=Stachybotrys elegans TaxID=80388 RepID=A0A8K0T6Q1_9HYPO|nr:hypothetical protein B0I35DRAFT_506636 [Stachybotrys elegans]